MTTFKVGDAIMHPIRGAGIIVDLIKRQWHGNDKMYYKVELLSHPDTNLMVPTSAVEELGLRRTISRSKLKEVWRVLRTNPKKLPADHKERYQIVDDKLHAGDVIQVAEVLRDMAGRRQDEGKLTATGERRYEEGISILAGEIAAVQGVDVSQAEAQVREKMMKTLE
jgi:RNA polymerase-interacting CarD/CdnL/TRCF family regulator